MQYDITRTFVIDAITFINFISLSDDQKKMVREWRNHEAIRRWMYTDHLISPQEHQIFIESLPQEYKNHFFLLKSANIDLGVLSLNKVDRKNGHAYFGVYANPESTLKGVGRLLAKLPTKLAFDIFELHTLKLEVIESNTHAINWYQKMSFVEEGRLKEFVYKENRWQDVIIMGITNTSKECSSLIACNYSDRSKNSNQGRQNKSGGRFFSKKSSPPNPLTKNLSVGG